LKDRRGAGATWLLGLADGVLLGIPGLVFGLPGVAVVLAVMVVSLAAYRSLPLLSGMLVGAGGLWASLLVRQILLICAEPDRAPGDPCVSSGLAAFAVVAASLVMLGTLVGSVAFRRRNSVA